MGCRTKCEFGGRVAQQSLNPRQVVALAAAAARLRVMGEGYANAAQIAINRCGRDNKRLTFAADSKPRKRCSPVSLVSMTGT